VTYPWNDYSGKLSPLKLAVFVALFLPAAWTAGLAVTGNLGPRPFTTAIQQQGLWTIRLILIALAITPLRALLQWPRLILVRRMVGVAAFTYIILHFSLYIADQGFDLLKTGAVQAIVFDAPTLQYWAAKRGRGSVQVVGPVFRPEKYGIAVPQGSPLRKQINEVLLTLYDDGKYDEIRSKWFASS